MKPYFFTFFFTLSSFVFAQTGNSGVDKLAYDYAKLSYQNVIESSKNLLKKEKGLSEIQKKEVLQKLSYSLFNINDYKQAEQYFGSLVNMSEPEADFLYKYAQVLTGNGKYLLASEMWSRYAQEVKEPGMAEEYSLLTSNPEPLTRNAGSYETSLVSFNTNLAEFSPVKYKDGLVFVSNRTGNSAIKRVFSWDDSPFLDLYFLENENEINNTSTSAGLSSSNYTASSKNKGIGADSYTRQTANDGPTLGFKGTSGFFDKPDMASNQFSKTLNSIYHEGPCQFFNNEQSVIFTRNGIKKLNYESSDELNRIHLFIAEREGNDWGNLSAFPFNDGEYSTGHPAFMPAEQILFFVSDKPNGYGGTDIYFSKYQDGRWFEPQNAGNKINTAGNEMFPFIDEFNVLYFSSDGHPGLGGLDIFSVPLNEWGLTLGNARNVGSPLNSAFDDFGILTDGKLGKGYFSSNRKNGGKDDDIYSFKRIGEQFGCKDVILAVTDSKDSQPLASLKFKYYEVADTKLLKDGTLDENGQAKLCLNVDSEYYFEFSSDGFESISQYFATNNLSDFKVNLLNVKLTQKVRANEIIDLEPPKVLDRERDLSLENRYKGVIYGNDNITPLEGVKIRFVNKCTDLATEFVTSADGVYDFERDVDCDYEFIAMKSGFAANYEFITSTKKNFVAKVKTNVTARKKKEESFFDPKIFKVGDVVKMDNIYYESKETELASKSKNDLDQLILVMETYPAMIIEVFSHTDSRGNDRENLILSQKRADEVKDYLTKKGISALRIRAVGMGEKQPVNSCGDGIQCTEAEYRRNRRTEFKILKIERI